MGLLIDTGVLIRVERGLRAIRASFCLAAFCPCRTGRDVDTARCDETLALPVLSRVPKAEIGAVRSSPHPTTRPVTATCGWVHPFERRRRFSACPRIAVDGDKPSAQSASRFW